MKGTLEQAGPRWRLRFTRDLDHPVPRVWRAVTDPGDLETWFPFRITGDWAVGSHLTFSDPQSRVPDFTRRGTRLPAARSAGVPLGAGHAAAGGRGAGHRVHPHPPAHVRRARQGGPGRGGLARAAWTRWPVIWTGTPRRRPSLWAEVHPGYVSSFGPEASAAGVPAGFEPG